MKIASAFCAGLAAIFMGSPSATIAQTVNNQPISCGETYFVSAGDTVGSISNRAYGPGRFRDLYDENVSVIGPNINLIEIGMELFIPCFAGASPPAAAAPELANGFRQTGERIEIAFNKSSAPQFILNTDIIDPYLAEITRVTEGRVTFVNPATINREGRAQLDLVTSGSAGGAYVFNGYLDARNPLLQITMQPMTGGSAVETAVALWRTQEEHFAKADNFNDVHLLGFIGAPPAHIWRVSDAPVTGEEQLVGNNAWTVPYFEGLQTRGAQAVRAEAEARIARFDTTPGAPPATYAIAHGTARTVGIWTESRQVTELDGGIYAPTFSVILNNDVWSSISAADQAAITSISGEALSLRSLRWDDFDNGHKAEMLAGGLELVPASPRLLAELQDNARASWEEWIRDADSEGVSGFQASRYFVDQVSALKAQFRPQS